MSWELPGYGDWLVIPVLAKPHSSLQPCVGPGDCQAGGSESSKFRPSQVGKGIPADSVSGDVAQLGVPEWLMRLGKNGHSVLRLAVRSSCFVTKQELCEGTLWLMISSMRVETGAGGGHREWPEPGSGLACGKERGFGTEKFESQRTYLQAVKKCGEAPCPCGGVPGVALPCIPHGKGAICIAFQDAAARCLSVF